MADQEKRLYIYCAERDEKRHKGKRSAYLVEKLGDKGLVARIHPIGFVREATVKQEIEIYATRRNLITSGSWSECANRQYKKMKVTPRKDYEDYE